ncbi:class I SAM-dependent methyltransferase [Streptomyces sp. NBC_01551]|uniref:class I SAM-dependent methyltransferase n=1 Tax=Streptomyces sp. NBC_01551 TaxID=2975876 RepID=UPI00225A6AF9|nr:methyltransferase domain-containing protein [Streptomyces sp. NBC_01551]MCX4529284.1 class I SAM-dependent methyltransferase [Streptomyces sp. NBC_01551]
MRTIHRHRQCAPRPDFDVSAGASAHGFADPTFDIVLLALVLRYVEDCVRALAELARVLHPDGRIIVSTSTRPRSRN